MRILGIAGSVRRGSHNRRLIRAAGDSLPSGVELVEWEGLAGLPIFDEDLEDSPPPAVQDFLDAVADSDGLLIATPEYNASVPGGLKNALDWASRPFPDNVLREKPSAVIVAKVLRHYRLGGLTYSVRDLLDGVALELAALHV